jgi:FKBP-type peptidyl-prolyl cis-trans isomerase
MPAALAYGAMGAGCNKDNDCLVPPDAPLEFVIELLSIK